VNARDLVLRYRKDPRVIITVPLLILAATSLIYYAVQRSKDLSPEALNSQVLLFVLSNINVLLILGSDHFPDPGVWAIVGPLVGYSFVGTGLYAWRRRPESRFGLLMVLLGFAWFLGPLPAADAPLVFTLGIVLGGLAGPLFGHVLLSFPTGRLPTRARRRLVAASYVIIPLAPLPALLVSDSDDVLTDCVGGCPRNVLLISRDAALGDAALAVDRALTLVLCIVAIW